MGAQVSAPANGAAPPSLDQLGGYYRKAVLLKDELNVKADMIAQSCLDQAERMESVMQLKGNGSTREQVLAAIGGPSDKSKTLSGFGNSTTVGTKPRRGPPSAAAAAGSAASGDPGRPGTAPVNSGPVFGAAARKAKAEAVANAKAAQQAEDDFKANHWRTRVEAAKHRLKLYLITYMAFMSVLKKKRVGSYADPLPVDSLPIILSNLLKENVESAGEHLVACGGLVHRTSAAAAKLSALTGGRMWLKKAKSHREDAQGEEGQDGQAPAAATPPSTKPSALPPALTPASDTSHSQQPDQPKQPSTVTWQLPPQLHIPAAGSGTPFAMTDGNKTAPSAAASPAKKRGGARAMVAAGAGANALEQAGMAVKKPQPVCSPELTQRASMLGKQQEDAVHRITLLYLQGAGRRSQMNSVQVKADMNQMVKQEAINLQVMASKANARWVEKHVTDSSSPTPGAAGWSAPTVLDAKTLAMGGVDMGNYNRSAGLLMSEGRLAVMLTYLGEDCPVGTDKYTGAELFEPCVQADLWAAVANLFPHKVPHSPYLSGLTLLDRRMLQLIIDTERAGGARAVEKLTVVLAVDAMFTAWVAEQAVVKAHWSLNPQQILVVSVARLPGMLWDPTSRTFKLNYSGAESYLPAGSGCAMLAMNWPSHTFFVNSEGREYMAGSCLSQLTSRGVTYLYSARLCDTDCLSPSCPTVDPGFIGSGLYCMDAHGANMAMQVTSSNTDQVARACNSVVLSRETSKMFQCSIPLDDLQSVATRPLLQSQVQSGRVVSCVSRYMMTVKHLQRIITGPNAFHIKVKVVVPTLNLELDAADLTSHPNTNCVAIHVPNKTQGPAAYANSNTSTKDWVRDLVPHLIAQDGQPALRQRLAKLSDMAKGPGATVPTTPLAGTASTALGLGHGGSTLLLFVRDNPVSRLAFKMALSCLGGKDLLHVVYVIGPEVAEKDAQHFLSSFSSVMSESRINRKVVRQRDKLVDTMASEVDSLAPTLVIMGSEALSKTSLDAKAGSTSSVTLSMVKAVTDASLMVVKSTSLGDMLLDSGVTAGCKRVVLEVSTAAQEPLTWLCARLTPDKDKLLLVRPMGIDKATGKETTTSQRMNQSLATEAQVHGVQARKLAMAENAGEGFPAVVNREKCDILTLLAPGSKVTPQHVVDLVKSVRTNVLIWRVTAGAPATPGAGHSGGGW